ncbi:carboxylesterase [Sulfurimicrobium lacus]|uniref:Carboxylesterase n=1 Tax=Sulfurimicrobium lacus TaxID=2715678 RepID=A0A6F8VHC8_9PROT|nr:alpha/beta fold hydrolase [Sulfurimicrobium lacus]BCB28507.1 carboxylesterase [Sulfurimicrobium lacus]
MDALEITTSDSPDSAVIWLHGLGADGHDFAPIVPELALPASAKIRFVFPHAPSLPVTINGGYVMPAWYDVKSLDLSQEEDAAGIRNSQHRLEALIHRERERGIASTRIVLAGFSQGGAIALHTGLRYDAPLAGVLALSTYLPLPHSLAAETGSANTQIPVFMAHGTADNVIPLDHGAASRDLLQQQGFAVEWHEYSMSHSVCAEEIADIGTWLTRILVI